jgi:hypothetical protein
LESTHIKYINSAFIHKEALEETLNDDQTLAQNQYDSVDPCSPAMEDGQESILRQKGKSEEKEVHQERNYRQWKYSADKERPELLVATKEPDATKRVRRGNTGSLEIGQRSVHRTRQSLYPSRVKALRGAVGRHFGFT